MRFYIQQKVFSLSDTYDVFDEMQNVAYRVQGKFFSIGAQISVDDAVGRQLYFIRQRITYILRHYELYRGNYLMADIRTEFAFFRPRLTVTSYYGNFAINGNAFGMDYEILKDGVPVGAVRKKWLSWGDTYELDIYDSFDPDFFVALVITIDHAIHKGSK